ncbi:hypothetical protein C8R44DRAFT_863451 [Mycena epipterygia]|nr:hypothetical protein C8R44DRAFT_863451 [Mycena epipterygia]
MALSDIPVDVLMEITGYLDLPDSLQLVATCSTCRILAGERYFWIVALNRLEQLHRRPLPCPPGTDITSLPLATLKKFAVHAYKLKKNWASEFPRAVSILRLTTDSNVLQFCPIETSPLSVTLSWTRIACWNITSGECVATFEHPAYALRKPVISAPYLAPGQCTFGIVYPRSSPYTMEFAVLQIDYHGSTVTISKVFSTSWTPALESLEITDVVVDEKMIAVILSTPSDHSTSFLLFSGFSDGIVHEISLGSNENATEPQALIYGDYVYIGRQHFDPFAEIQRVRTSANDLKMVSTKLDIPVPRIAETALIGWSSPRYPKYGILNVTTRTYRTTPDGDDDIFGLHFWPAEITDTPMASEVINLKPLCFYEHCSPITDAGVGSSGTCVAITDEAKMVGLVQYISHESHPTTKVAFRPLRLPGIELGDTPAVALDDRLGIIYLPHPTEPGTFNIISYA